ncbi:MAG: YhbY family RNA-binding protein [Clostridia bacterium]|nr:YhbY family RNA-binding protein [Clostridia bacterium]
MLTSKDRAFLRGIANTLPTTQQIGKDGITEAVCRQADEALNANEMIKLRVLETSLLTAREASEQLCAALGAEPVQCIGSRLVLYRPSPDEPQYLLPSKKKK